MELWPKEAADKLCSNNKYVTASNQAACQTFCEEQRTCVGISYSYKSEKSSDCYICSDDNLDAFNGFGFYRRPHGNNRLYRNQYISIHICNICIVFDENTVR